MAGAFSFGSNFTSDRFVTWVRATTGAGAFDGIDNPARFHLVGEGNIATDNAVQIVPIALNAGETIGLDVDFGSGGANPINTELWVVNANGALLASNDTSTVDDGSVSTADPKLSFTADSTGVFFIAVTQAGNDYIGDFKFGGGGSDTGDFQLDISIGSAALPALINFGGADNNFFDGANVDNRINAGDGNDTINAGGGRNWVAGGLGNDTLTGGDGFDQLFGGAGDDQLSGGDSDDVLIGGDGNDGLLGNNGADKLFGGAGSDGMIGGQGNDILRGEAGFDTLDGGPGNDILDGGALTDTVSYLNATGDVVVDLAIKTAQNTGGGGIDRLISIESIIGSHQDDTLKGSSINNQIFGDDGQDTLLGRGGADFMQGQGGDDILVGGVGDDFLNGGAGSDRLTGGSGFDRFIFLALSDFASGPDIDRITDFTKGQDLIALDNVDANINQPGDQGFTFKGTDDFSGIAQLRFFQTADGNTIVEGNVDSDAAADFQFRLDGLINLEQIDFLL